MGSVASHMATHVATFPCHATPCATFWFLLPVPHIAIVPLSACLSSLSISLPYLVSSVPGLFMLIVPHHVTTWTTLPCACLIPAMPPYRLGSCTIPTTWDLHAYHTHLMYLLGLMVLCGSASHASLFISAHYASVLLLPPVRCSARNG